MSTTELNRGAELGGRVVMAAHCLTALLVYLLSLKAFLHRWRAKDPFILTRLPLLSVFIGTAALGMIWLIDLAVIVWPHFNPRIVFFLPSIAYAFILLPFVLKAFLLWFRFNLSREVLKVRVTFGDRPSELSDYMRLSSRTVNLFQTSRFAKRKAVTNPYVVAMTILIFGGLMFIAPSVHVATNLMRQKFLMYSHLSFGAFLWFIAALLAIGLRREQDVWGIRRELIYFAIIGLQGMILLVIFFFIQDFRTYTLYQSGFRLTSIFVILVFSTLILAVLYIVLGGQKLNFRVDEPQDSMMFVSTDFSDIQNSVITVEEFDNLLKDSEFYDLFKRHLVRELSVEHLAFWSSVREFESLQKEAQNWTLLPSFAVKIFETFIEERSEFEVNIPVEVRNMARNHLRELMTATEQRIIVELSSKVFTLAKFEVINLISQDSFWRFAKTTEFKEFRKRRMLASVLSNHSTRSTMTTEGSDEDAENKKGAMWGLLSKWGTPKTKKKSRSSKEKSLSSGQSSSKNLKELKEIEM